MALARRLTSLGRAARGEASVKVRQPLKRALVFLPAGSPEILRDIVADELNVDEVDTADELSEVIQFELKPNFKTLGSRLKDLRPRGPAGTGRARHRSRRGRARGGTVHHRRPGRPGGRAVARRRGAAGPGPAGLRRLTARAARWWRWTWTSTRACASGGCPATWCGSFRTCARRRAWRSPTASACTSWGSTSSPSSSTSSPARCWRCRIVSGPGEGEGVVLELDDELLDRAGAGLDRAGRSPADGGALLQPRVARQQGPGERDLDASGGGRVEHDEAASPADDRDAGAVRARRSPPRGPRRAAPAGGCAARS